MICYGGTCILSSEEVLTLANNTGFTTTLFIIVGGSLLVGWGIALKPGIATGLNWSSFLSYKFPDNAS